MDMKLKSLLVGLMVALLISACAPELEESMVTIKDGNKALQRMNELRRPVSVNMTKVSVARLEIGDKVYQVTSLRPEILSAGSKENTSWTLLLFNDKRDRLIFFTHDGQKNIGYQLQLALTDFREKEEILFPVVDVDSAQVLDKTITLVKLTER